MCRANDEGGRRCTESHIAGRKLRNLQAKKQYWDRQGASDKVAAVKTEMEQLRQAEAQLVGSGATLESHHLELTPAAKKVLDSLRQAGLNPYVVGGSVRDSLLGKVSKDVDIEVYGGDTKAVEKALRKVGKVDAVGQAFGVLKISIGKEDFDVSLPRRDSKTDAGGHKGFEVTVDHNLTLNEATSRRDFTVNALMYDDKLEAIIDEHGGLKDMRAGVLRHVSDAFAEDPLRVLRGIQMSSRFGMTLHPDTVKLSQDLSPEFSSLAKERVQMEFQKMFEKGNSHHRAIQVLESTGWSKHFPGLDEADKGSLSRSLQTTSNLIADGRIPAEKRGWMSLAVIASHIPDEDKARNTLSYMSVGDDFKNRALMLSRVEAPVKQGAAKLRAFAWDMPRNLTIRDWATLRQAVKGVEDKKAKQLLAKAEKWGIADGAELPWVNGNDLIAVTKVTKPGKWMRTTVNAVRAAQYDRAFTTREEGIAWVKANKEKLFPSEVL